MDGAKNKWYYIKLFAVLHLSLFISSLSGVASKLAAKRFPEPEFFFYYGLVLAIMAAYAFLWQQILKRIPLTVAFANKPVTLVWGMILGKIIFGEAITWNMLLGAGIIFFGIYLVVTADE